MFGNPPTHEKGAGGFVATRPLRSIAAALLLALPQYSSAAAPATVKKAAGRVATRPLHSIATALLLSLPLWPIPTALAVAAAVAAGGNADGSAEQELGYPEGALARVLTLPAPAADAGSNIAAWRLSGPDAAQFRLLAGALRFVAPPDFETPQDANGDNIYEVTLHPAASGNAVPGAEPAPEAIATGVISTSIRVTDRNEPGRLLPSTGFPAMGETVLAQLSDPDGVAQNIDWRWERSGGRDEWLAIPGADTAAYTPTAADTGHWLRVLAKYEDRLGGPRQHVALLPETVLGPTLAALTARTDHGGSALHPPFAPNIQHYGIACAERDVLSIDFGLPEEAGAEVLTVSVNGIQPRPGRESGAAVAVDTTSDANIVLSSPTGASTTYTIHCLPPELAAIRTSIPPGAPPLPVRLAVATGSKVAILDQNGVARFHQKAEGDESGFFLRSFGSGPDLRWAHLERPVGPTPQNDVLAESTALAETAPPAQTPARRWRVLDRDFGSLGTFSAKAPLKTTGRHDFRLLEDGGALLMTYEPAVRDFGHLSFPDSDGEPWGSAVETQDSAIQWQGPDGEVRWTWNSWGRLPLVDCAQHAFPGDYAHINSLQWTGQGVLASFRGCSAIVMIDPFAPRGQEIVWRLGASNLSVDDWSLHGFGPPPLTIVGDPEGEFCGQHAAQLLPPPPGLSLPRLLLFDNGVACVTDPHTGKPLGRQGEVYSRALEYALDPKHGEAVFVRDHALGNTRDRLGFAGGHVAVLPDGDWLVSWGSGGGGGGSARGDGEGVGLPPTDRVTRVDPDTGAETFSIPYGEAENRGALRALPVAVDTLRRPPGALRAQFPDAPPQSHGGAGDTFSIAVSFSRPVSVFGPNTPSIAVSGGELVGAEALVAFGRPAHSFLLTIAPAGNEPVRLSLKPGIGCGAERGICAADGTRLTGAPEAMVIPGQESPEPMSPPAGGCA